LKFEIIEEAVLEAQQAAEYLDRARPGLGEAFITALEDEFARLQGNPDIGVSADFGHTTRQWRLARFPYSIIYFGGSRRLVVVAIAHDRRRPGYWRKRLR
jgi:plasmid stabilization system protein ParE